MKVRCIRIFDSRGNPVERSSWLTIGKTYPVLSMIFQSNGERLLRLIGDGQNGVALFKWESFEVVTSDVPANWRIDLDEHGRVELAPKPWITLGFWNRFYDQDAEAIRIFQEERKKIIDAEP
jgi:hypothetical protein